MYDWLVVGAGFGGSVLAERIASERNEKVLVIDRRNHIGGNAYDYYNDDGIRIHKYGPHIFHTNSEQIFKYLSRFTEWNPYEHRVLGYVDGQLVPIPINLTTINTLYGLRLSSAELQEWFDARAEDIKDIRTSEDVVISKIGKELYEKFFKGYTRKQWGLDPSELDKTVTARIPIRTNTDDRYFTDTYQYMPKHGYSKLFENLLSHKNINLMTQTDFIDIKDVIPYKRIIYTGAIDEYFSYIYGKLPYRSLRFSHVTSETSQYQKVGTINYPQTEDYTRISEYKHMTFQDSPRTTVTFEYPSEIGDPYYPIPRAENQAIYKKYEELGLKSPDIWFVGRLATYRYYNMDQVVGQSLATFQRIQNSLPQEV